MVGWDGCWQSQLDFTGRLPWRRTPQWARRRGGCPEWLDSENRQGFLNEHSDWWAVVCQAAKSGTTVTLAVEKGAATCGTCWTSTSARELVKMPLQEDELCITLTGNLRHIFLFASSIWQLYKGLKKHPYFVDVLSVFLNVPFCKYTVTIKKHFQQCQFSKHTATPVAIYEICCTFLDVHRSGC